MVIESWCRGHKRALWLSVSSDLELDARRDLEDVGGGDIPVHNLTRNPYGCLDSRRIGVECMSILVPCHRRGVAKEFCSLVS